ncbi:SdrD B-like domain-containing protein [Lentzea aerocolonigenes]|uniref:SdrD B-like domain-containing protein n=1 Tax=Lentzea aerocolonigenes TaxID=68170 RepID=UPI000697574D|nr:SdrD B-like domain-containing protein [Lentzea aerocolonigenes]
MSEGSIGRALLKFGAFTTAMALTFGSASVAAFAQDDPTSAPVTPTETSAPPTSSAETPPPPPAPEPPASTGQVQAVPQTGVSGVVYADKNRNGSQDPGEAFPDQRIMLAGSVDNSWHETTSDADGNFAFTGLTPGVYRLRFYEKNSLDDGWVVHFAKPTDADLTVKANEMTKAVVRAERAYSEQITATATLDRDSYRLPAAAKITLKLVNNTDRRINNIKALCNENLAPHALGQGSGWDALVANGVSLDAGKQIRISIDEEIPEAASKNGLVTLDCRFAPNVGWTLDGPSVHAEAKASGGVGAYTMQLGEDRNANSRIDADEVERGVKVLLLNPITGEQVAEVTSDADGKVEFGGQQIGEYRAVVLGSWMFADPGQQLVRITGQGGSGYGFLKRAAPADLRVTVQTDKPSYESHETVRLDLIVTNVGGQTAERVRLDWPPLALDVPMEAWGDFRYWGPGVQIPAGESRTFSISGPIKDARNGRLDVHGRVEYLGRPDEHQPSYFHGSADVVVTTGDVTGFVYTDKNSNGLPDPGEAAEGVEVKVNGWAMEGTLKASTDASGGFTFKDLPSGGYWVEYALNDGWMVHLEGGEEPYFRVRPGPPVQLTGRADRPYRELLKASMALDKPVYMVGEDVKLTVTLTNTSDRRIVGIQAGCNRVGDSHHLGGGMDAPMPESWGDLRYSRPGVTLAAGETRTIVVTEKVPVGARSRQQVVAACDFEPNPGYNVDGPFVITSAGVPGGFGALTGPLAHDRNGNHAVDPGEAIPNARILLLLDRDSDLQVADTVSDAQGNVRFGQLPPGEFWAQVDGPWKFEGDNPGRVEVRVDTSTSTQFFVVPALTPSGDDQPGGGVRGALAKTGASVLGLAAIAALLVAFGIGARVAGRRKTS